MTTFRRRLFPVLLASSVAGALIVIVLFALAFDALSTGPTLPGYASLESATRSLPVLALVVVLTVAARVDIRHVRFAVGGLGLASGVVAGAAAGLGNLGGTLANIQPAQQPQELNSLLLAVAGSGTVIAPAAVVLALGAALVGGVSAFARWITLDFYDRAVAVRAEPSPDPI